MDLNLIRVINISLTTTHLHSHLKLEVNSSWHQFQLYFCKIYIIFVNFNIKPIMIQSQANNKRSKDEYIEAIKQKYSTLRQQDYRKTHTKNISSIESKPGNVNRSPRPCTQRQTNSPIKQKYDYKLEHTILKGKTHSSSYMDLLNKVKEDEQASERLSKQRTLNKISAFSTSFLKQSRKRNYIYSDKQNQKNSSKQQTKENTNKSSPIKEFYSTNIKNDQQFKKQQLQQIHMERFNKLKDEKLQNEKAIADVESLLSTIRLTLNAKDPNKRN